MLFVPAIAFAAIAIPCLAYWFWTGKALISFENDADDDTNSTLVKTSELSEEFRKWRSVFTRELESHLASLREDDDIYGFTLGLPAEFDELIVISGVARESTLKNETADSEYWLDRRYAPDWEFIPQSGIFDESCEQLERIFHSYKKRFPEHSMRRDGRCCDDFNQTCLDAMIACNKRGLFGSIWFKMVYISDSNLPIITRSFYKLNQGRAIKEGRSLYPRFGWLTERLPAVIALIKTRFTRWMVGAKR